MTGLTEWRIRAALVAALVVAGCSSTIEGQTECKSDADCTGAAKCSAGVCQVPPPPDTTPPSVTITSQPDARTRARSADLEFRCSEESCTFECSFDAAPAGPCESPASYVRIADGPHTFEIRATDAAGNQGAAARAEWTVDTTGPQTTLRDPKPASPTRDTATSISFSCSEPPCTFECALDGADFAACTSPHALTALGEGSHTFEVRATDDLGNVGDPPASHTWQVDLTPPETQLTGSLPPALTSSASAELNFACDQEPCTFECQLDAEGWSSCASPLALAALDDGSHLLQVRAVDLAGNTDPTPASHTWSVDATAPQTTFAGATPPDPSNFESATLAFNASEPGCSFECQLEPAGWAPCTSPQTVGPLAEGPHLFRVRAIDRAGNVDPTPATIAWRVDQTPPDTAIDSAPPAKSNLAAPTFAFGSPELDATFECALDGAAYQPCTSPRTLAALAEGLHVFRVRAADAAGNLDSTPATHSWTVDLTAPETTVVTPPSAMINNTELELAFTSSEPGSTFECALDGAAFTACTSPHALSGLAESAHAFRVRATDPSGNLDPTPALAEFTVDLAVPDTTITAKPPAASNQTSATLAFASTKQGATFECRFDGGAWARCSSPFTQSGLAEAEHVFEVRCTDPAGNVDPTPATWSWTVDLTPPETALTAHPPSLDPQNLASFGFSSPDTGCTFECQLDGGAWAPCASPHATAVLADGEHHFAARAVDAATNADATPEHWTWTIDTTVPNTAITSNPAALSNRRDPTFQFEATEPGCSFECQLDGAPWAPCTSPHALSGLADGTHSFAVRATDPAGNLDATAAVFAWEVDATPPVTTLTRSPAADYTRQTTATLTFTSEARASFECKLDLAAWAPCISPQVLSALADGSHTFSVRATDAAGNAELTPVSQTWTIDATPPETTITSAPPALSNAEAPAFEFVSDPGVSFECQLDGGAWLACASPYLGPALDEGPHSFAVRATDRAGNLEPAPATHAWTIDTSAPDTAFSGALPAAYTRSTLANFAFVTEQGATFECQLDAAPWAACSSPQSLTVAEGAHTFSVRAKDGAGNVDPSPASHSWTVDRTDPQTSLVAPLPADPTNNTMPTIAFACDEAGCSFVCSMDGGAPAPCTSPYRSGGLAVGPHTFSVAAIDRTGNRDLTAATHAWSIDLEPPDTALIAPIPPSSTNSSSATFYFDALGEAGCTFECQRDWGAWEACSSPKTYIGLPDGLRYFVVRAVDRAGNADPEPADYGWWIDATPPQTSFTSALPPAATRQTSAVFSFTCGEMGCSFQCSLDGAAPSSCYTSKSYSNLAAGTHTFTVVAQDASGNVDPTPATHTWTIDLTAPVTTFTTTPVLVSSSGDATFAFTASEIATFECSLDAEPFAGCTSGVTRTGLSSALHTFRVRATDAAGNVEAAPATWSWTVSTSFVPVGVSAGENFACAVTSAGAVRCWGSDTLLQLGDGDASRRAKAAPVEVSGVSGAVQVDAGRGIACAVTAAGEVYCWGNGAPPAKVVPAGATAVSVGNSFGCAIVSGGAVCWGTGSSGQLGDGTLTSRPTPAGVLGLESGVTAISAGDAHACALTGGAVWCWGWAEYGQLGVGIPTDLTYPLPADTGLRAVTRIAAGAYHTCAVDAGIAKCWGTNSGGQSTGSGGIDVYTPLAVPGVSSPVAAVAAGRGHSCALSNSGSVECWGMNQRGQLGDGTNAPRTGKVVVAGGDPFDADALEAGTDFTCGIADGAVKCWGRNDLGQLGIGSAANQPIPSRVQDLAATRVSAGTEFACAVTQAGDGVCWGHNQFLQLGSALNVDARVPQTVPGLQAGLAEIAAGGTNACARTSAGSVWCWGQNVWGQVGDGTVVSPKPPTAVLGVTAATAVAVGGRHSCAIDGGVAKCWGLGNNGQLGRGASSGNEIPAPVVGLPTAASIAAGESHSCAATAAGAAFCWGNNMYGQLGDGTGTGSLVPVAVQGLSSGVVSVGAGNSHTCALVGTGVKCWGANTSGQLGLGRPGNELAPRDVLLPGAATAVAAGGFTTCALMASGEVMCWGQNTNGMLGNAAAGVNSQVPLRVVGVTGATGIAVGYDAVCARLASGEVRCWGTGVVGQIGDGNAWSPTPVPLFAAP